MLNQNNLNTKLVSLSQIKSPLITKTSSSLIPNLNKKYMRVIKFKRISIGSIFLFFCMLICEKSAKAQVPHDLSQHSSFAYHELNLNNTTKSIISQLNAPPLNTNAFKYGKVKDKLDDINNFMQWYLKYFPFPYASYSNETSWLFGLSKYNAFRLKSHGKVDSMTQASSVTCFLYGTLNRQYKIVLETNFMFYKNNYNWKTTLAYVDYPLEYFGIGNETKLEDQKTLITTDWQMSSYFLFRTWKKWYIGPVFDVYNYEKVKLAEDEAQLPNYNTNADHVLGTQSGLGLKIIMEGRDNRLNAKKGYYVETGYQLFRDFIGSQFNYDAFYADFRYYVPLAKKVTLGAQIHTESKVGEVPVQSLSLLGGDYFMRGTYRGRYRDNVLLDAQMELRFPIYWIFSGVVFGSSGQVAPAYDQLYLNKYHYNYGAGLRLTMDSEHDVNIRFDVGRSSDQTIFIVNVSEAF